MPIIAFTPADALVTAVMPDGAYSLELTEISAPKQSASGKSLNWYGKIRVTNGEFKDKEFQISFNNAMSNSSLLGSTMYFPFGALLQINAVLSGKEVKPESVQLDTDQLINKSFDGQIKKVINDAGNPGNLIVAFLPAGSATGPAPFGS